MKFAAVAVLASVLTIGISAQAGSSGCEKKACSPNDPKVCASNGVTYTNRCEFDYENCENGNYQWTVVRNGTCRRGDGGR
ncbi:hypothetical protein PR003_g20201 [Phytophthora rubi]|uniref:Kazal-like domain-containing protein n=1 Tax=Phytophthora rubi TaxID=129364 RepID=A0A6A3K5F1_9STRA|nr:hypothetical protein PR001_g19039 [Phytophthora rubi]KAE9310707.1 hypothetical protein PR003_g20201 [Phytophthora rubi]